MSLRYGMVGLFLALVFVLLIVKNYETWNQPIEALPEKEMTKKQEKKSEPNPITKDQEESTSIKTYVGIADKNIFSPERKEFPITPIPGGDMKKPLSRPQIVLYGITIVGDYQSATVSTPGKPLQKGERETTTLKIGESVGEYKVSKIISDRIMMAAGEDSFEVLLHDPKMPKKRTFVKTESKPAAVVSVSPSTASTSPAALSPPSSTLTNQGVGRPAGEVPGRVVPPRPFVPAAPTSPMPYTRRGRLPMTQPPGSAPPSTPVPTSPSTPITQESGGQ
jgi:hypothetical protein